MAHPKGSRDRSEIGRRAAEGARRCDEGFKRLVRDVLNEDRTIPGVPRECGTCNFVNPGGWCQRYPKWMAGGFMGRITDEHDWCGEYRAAPVEVIEPCTCGREWTEDEGLCVSCGGTHRAVEAQGEE